MKTSNLSVTCLASRRQFRGIWPPRAQPNCYPAGRPGQYIASASTFYRVFRAERLLQHRRTERPGQPRSKPRALRATAPRRMFSSDSKYLYLFLDILSRKIFGCQVYKAESSELASEVMRDICRRENIRP